MKTYQEWKGNLEEYLNINDEVDQELIDYIINCLPGYAARGIVQLGEAYSHDEYGKAIYFTFKRQESKWIFKGFCRRGEIEAINNYFRGV